MFIGVVMGSMLFKMVFISLFALVFYKKHPDTSTYVLVALMFQYLLLTVFSILRLQKIVLNN
jgi:Ca2+/Na+ antiporter